MATARVLQENLPEDRLVLCSHMVRAAKALPNVLHSLSLSLGGHAICPAMKFALPGLADRLELGGVVVVTIGRSAGLSCGSRVRARGAIWVWLLSS